MGGDDAPGVPVRGGVAALRELEANFELVLVGRGSAIEEALEGLDVPADRLSLVAASETIAMDESPVEAIRRKTDSSIVRGVKLQQSGEVDAFVSAGSTGAILASSMFLLGTLPGMDRPAIGALLPTAAEHPTLLIDVGANADCSPAHLEQFAHLGHVYMRDLRNRAAPRIGLLNIGGEAGKGDQISREAYRLLSASGLDFAGNVEGRDILNGDCDVIVCGGFVGNVVLKFYESVSGHVVGIMKREAASTAAAEIDRLCGVLDYAEYGGAPLLGVDGVTIICHGDSSVRAIRNAVQVAVKAVESGMVEHLRSELSGLAAQGN